MPIYEDKEMTREALFELRRQNRCQVCHGELDVFLDVDKDKAFLACRDWRRTQHEGIEREAEPPFEPNIPTWRKDMEEKLGTEKANKLMKYRGVTTLSREQALEIFELFWPEAPYKDRLKAAIICHQYGLNPLLDHIALIKFNKYEYNKDTRRKEKVGENYAVVQEIASTRIIAHRRHNYSFLDLSPRRMTDDEQIKVNGEVDKSRIWAITLIKDLATGAEFSGVGSWPIDEDVYGSEQGNTKLNMAKIRSERNALDRAYPAELPQGVEVIAENLLEGEFAEVTEGPPSKPEVGGATKPGAVGGEEKAGVGAPPTEDKSQKIAGAPPAKPSRDPETIKTIQELYKACHEAWGLQPKDVLKELGVSSQSDIADTPANLYRQIAAVRS